VQDLLHLADAKVDVDGNLSRCRLPAELPVEPALRLPDPVQSLDDVRGHADRARLVRERPRHRLPDPPRRVGRELEASAVVELLHGANEPERPFLDEIEKGKTLVAVPLRDRDDKPQVGLDHLLLSAGFAPLDPLRELDFLSGGEQIHLADVLQERLQCVRVE